MKYLTSLSEFKLLTENKRYEHINFIPPKTVSNQAKKGLKYRKKYKPRKGELAVKIAKKLIRRDKLTPSKIKQMATFFSRNKHRDVYKKFEDEPWKDRRYVNYLLWGGESGRAWAERVRTQMARADKKKD